MAGQKKKAAREIFSQMGNKLDRGELTALQDTGISGNRVLKIAGSSKKVGSRASGDLMKINPGIQLPENAFDEGTLEGGRTGGVVWNAIATDNVGKQVKAAGKNYLQWNGTDAKGKPLAVGGYKIPKEMRNADRMTAGRMAYNKGVGGTYLGRTANTLLNQKGEMRNKPVNLSRGALSLGGGKGNGGGGGNRNGGGMGGGGGSSEGYGGDSVSMPEATASSSTQYMPGGTGSYVDGNATGFRRRRSSARIAGLTSKGTSQFKIGGQTARSSGLNIGV
jgi:hypothetical protein